MEPLLFDFVVLGGGSAGYAAARTAVSLGLTTCVVDGAEELGGLCILRGCMPSKTLIESANRNLTLRRAHEFGLQANPGAPNIQAIRDRKRTLIHDFASYRQGQLNDGRFTLLRGHARFTGSHALEVTLREGGLQSLSFKSCCIATGSVVTVPDMPGLAATGFWTSDDILDAEDLPASFAVLGGGAIALEMAHYLDAMDRKVTLLQRGMRVLSFMDPECGDTVANAYRARGITVHCGTQIKAIERTAIGKRITFVDASGEHLVDVNEILLATGRTPNIQGLALEQAAVQTTRHKVTINDQMQTSSPHIFAAGDVCSPLDVVHIAIQQGEAAARNAAALLNDRALPATVDYRLRLFGVFSHPEVAGVGSTEEELRKANVPFITASYPFNDHGKSMVRGETEGFVKLIAHPHTGEILGGTVLGPEATELIHEVVVAMSFRATVHQFAAVPHYHPTLSEIWTYPAEELADQVPL